MHVSTQQYAALAGIYMTYLHPRVCQRVLHNPVQQHVCECIVPISCGVGPLQMEL